MKVANMAGKSEIVQKLDLVQKGLAELLKPLGFHRRGRTFFRNVDTDLKQVIALQAGQFEIGPPLPSQISYLRPNLYGYFTVNLGVFVPEILERSNPGFTPRGIITDAHCSIRKRLSHIGADKDYWWSLAADHVSLINDIWPLLIDAGLPFMDRFNSRDAIVNDWVRFNEEEFRISNVARLDTAMILIKRGQVGEAKSLFEEHVRIKSKNKNHEGYVRELALRLGLGELK